MSNLIQYEHHGAMVWVREELKGKHRENCLCWICDKMNPADRNTNCPIANQLYDICVKNNLTVCIYECPEFVKRNVNV